jgi:hypothetical protein
VITYAVVVGIAVGCVFGGALIGILICCIVHNENKPRNIL